jgi:hypothetical protein
VENLNRCQELKKKSSKEAASSHIIAFNHCRSTGIEQDPLLPKRASFCPEE